MNLNNFTIKKIDRHQALTVLNYLNIVISEIKETILQSKHDFHKMQLICDLVELSSLALRIMNRYTTLRPGKKLNLTLSPTCCLVFIKYQKMYENKAPKDIDTSSLITILASQIHQQFIDLNP